MASLAYSIVEKFEETVAEYTGSKYAVAVESGTAAIFLSLMHLKDKHQKINARFGIPNEGIRKVFIPKYTYPSVPASIIHAGGQVVFEDKQWSGIYNLAPYAIYDAALRFRRNMFSDELKRTGNDSIEMCLSFHAKKLLPIGRGGMILTNDKEARDWFRLARFDGREPSPLSPNSIKMVGWNMYMTPEQAARGLQLFDMMKTLDLPDLEVEKQGYPNLSKFKIYQQ